MTVEEYIKKQLDRFEDEDISFQSKCKLNRFSGYDLMDAYDEGAKNQWHKEYETPIGGENVLAYVRYGDNTYGYEIVYFTVEWNGKNLSHYDKVLYWMPIPKIKQDE